jgi:uncharacterized membrane protein YhhN
VGRRATGGFALLAAADVGLAAVGPPRLRWVTKPLLMPALLPGRDAATQRALALGWAGDVALLARGEAAFVVGLGAFLASHVAWVDALRRRDLGGRLRSRAPWAVLEVAAAGAVGHYLWRRTGPLRVPVSGYSVVLLAMALAALDRRSASLALGGGLFLVSDALLALERFGDLPLPPLDPVVMATYTAAQALLAGAAQRSG